MFIYLKETQFFDPQCIVQNTCTKMWTATYNLDCHFAKDILSTFCS